MGNRCTEEDFLRCVAGHVMQIVKDDGTHRHIRYRTPGDFEAWFDVLTWPDYLCITGDYGTFVFQRAPDMFNFFRGKADGGLRINPRYWSEKVRAADHPHGGVKEYSPEKFAEYVKDYFDDYIAEDMTEEERAERWEQIEDNVLGAGESEITARQAVADFGDFWDFWERDLTEFTYRFIWCLYAIVWAIRQYDASKAENKAA